MSATYHGQVEQGSDEWLAMRCGLLTASEMKHIVTPSLKAAANDKTRAHLYELAAQRITRYVEPSYISDDMLRGMQDEVDARILYSERYETITDGGFVTNDKWGFTLGYSPDGLIGAKGLWECKSRRQRYQVQTVLEHLVDANGATIPTDYLIQVQTGLAVADDREWLDFTSYSGGLPMVTIRVWPDDKLQAAIIEAAQEFEAKLATRIAQFTEAVARFDLPPTERKIIQEMF